ncbi:DUF3616 domain-containing protein [Mycolicibacterium moriokaense]|nr:DUF3616 domain-containing protein [Mycolicibacterium moriokaense]
MANWLSRVANALGLKKKVKASPFDQTNAGAPFNASGVVQVGADRFVFVDNRDPSALFELTLDADGVESERISRRPLAGLVEGDLLDPEGLTRVGRDDDGHPVLVVASSLCATGGNGPSHRHVSDGLVRVRYTPHGDLHAEPMHGFRDWLVHRVPSIADAAERDPDDGGLNIEGLAWQPDTAALLFGLRGPADRGSATLIRIPIDAPTCRWKVESLGPPSLLRVALPRPKAKQGIRDISLDELSGTFLLLLGRATSTADEPFQLCTWDGGQTVDLLDLKFRRNMKPEGVVAFTRGDDSRLLIVDDRGGYAVVAYPARDQ